MPEAHRNPRWNDPDVHTSGVTCAANALPRIQIGVVENDMLVREGLAALLTTIDEFDCVGAWGHAHEALAALQRRRADVVLLDARQVETYGPALFDRLLSAGPATRVILTTDCPEEWWLVVDGQPLPPQEGSATLSPRLPIGVCNIVYKEHGFQRIAECIRRAYFDRQAFNPNSTARRAGPYLPSPQTEKAARAIQTGSLTLRETEVFRLIGQGRSNKEIALEMDLSYSTVKNYVSSILQKLQLDGRTQIALAAQQMYREGRRPPIREAY